MWSDQLFTTHLQASRHDPDFRKSCCIATQDDSQAYVVTEACYGGTLEDFLRVGMRLDLRDLRWQPCVCLGCCPMLVGCRLDNASYCKPVDGAASHSCECLPDTHLT